MATCPNCNKEVKENAKFCRYCGTKIEKEPEFIYCDDCGAKLEAGATFCEECGANLGAPAKEEDPWADFKDFSQPKTVAEKVDSSKSKADMAKIKKDFEKGCAFYDAQEYASALPLLLPLAQEGDSDAQFRVGYCYLEGQQFDKALDWLEKARAQGHPKASYNIAWMSCALSFRGVQPDGGTVPIVHRNIRVR